MQQKAPVRGRTVRALRPDACFLLVEANHCLGICQVVAVVRIGRVGFDPLAEEGDILLGFLEEHFGENEAGGVGGGGFHNIY